jgi:hypothetical protein
MRGMGYVCSNVGDAMTHMQSITHRIYWNKKVKIAILALATFIAMC